MREEGESKKKRKNGLSNVADLNIEREATNTVMENNMEEIINPFANQEKSPKRVASVNFVTCFFFEVQRVKTVIVVENAFILFLLLLENKSININYD